MDLSFDLYNAKGDHVLVALSGYDQTSMAALTDDTRVLDLCFYDVSLVRKHGNGMVGYQVLMRIAGILADFLKANEEAVLCFYCDARSDLERHHKDLPPQQYRSILFSRMFDMYVQKYEVEGIVNYPVIIVDEDPWKSQYAHFICRTHHLTQIEHIGAILANKED